MILTVYFAIMGFVVFFDIFSKYLVQNSQTLMRGGTIDIIPGVLRFRHTYNEGAAMGMLTDNRWVFMIMSTVSIIAIFVFIILYRKKLSILYGVAISMIAGGGIGNMYERIFNGDVLGEGKVTDFIDFCAFPKVWPWIFNVADAFVCIGAGLFILAFILGEIKISKQKKLAITDENVTADDGISSDEDISDGDLHNEQKDNGFEITSENDCTDEQIIISDDGTENTDDDNENRE